MRKHSNVNPASLTILIVDDSLPFRRALCRLLRARFPLARLVEAGSVGDTRRAYARTGADLVFVDLHLPDGNGSDVVRMLRQQPGEPELCLMTLYDIPEYRDWAYQCGAKHFLAKSTSSSAEIIAVVEAIPTRRATFLGADACVYTTRERALSC